MKAYTFVALALIAFGSQAEVAAPSDEAAKQEVQKMQGNPAPLHVARAWPALPQHEH